VVPTFTLLTRLVRFIEDLQRRVAALEHEEDEISSVNSYVDQNRARPNNGMVSQMFLSLDLTSTAEENVPMAEAGLDQTLEDDADLTNPLSTGPSAFTVAGTGRTCELFRRRGLVCQPNRLNNDE
jgi:proline utilization trans-activator